MSEIKMYLASSYEDKTDAGMIADAILRSCGPGKTICIGSSANRIAAELRAAGGVACTLSLDTLRSFINECPASERPLTQVESIVIDNLDCDLDPRGKREFVQLLHLAPVKNVLIEIRKQGAPIRAGDYRSWDLAFLADGFIKHPLSRSMLGHNDRLSQPNHTLLLFAKRPHSEQLKEAGLFQGQYFLSEATLYSDLMLTLADGMRRYVRENARILLGEGLQDVATVLRQGTALESFDELSEQGELTIEIGNHQTPPKVDLAVLKLESELGAQKDLELVKRIGPLVKPGGRIVLLVSPKAETGAIENEMEVQNLSTCLGRYFVLDQVLHFMSESENLDGEEKVRLVKSFQTEKLKTVIVAALVFMLVPDISARPESSNEERKNLDTQWLMSTLIGGGLRLTSPLTLEQHALDVIQQAVAGSADSGAGICVLAYRVLEKLRRGDGGPDELRFVESKVKEFFQTSDSSLRAVRRWRISSAYVLALLFHQNGNYTDARHWFMRCVEIDPLSVTPLIATKTVGAFYRLGVLSLSEGNRDEALAAFKKGVDAAVKINGADWEESIGHKSRPDAFALPEIAQVALLAGRCAAAVRFMCVARMGEGRLWESMHAGTKAVQSVNR